MKKSARGTWPEFLQTYGIWMGICDRNGGGGEFPCGAWISFILTVDADEEPMKHDGSGENSEDHEIIFQYWLAGVIDKTSRTETVAGRVCECMPNNPVGFVEDF